MEIKKEIADAVIYGMGIVIRRFQTEDIPVFERRKIANDYAGKFTEEASRIENYKTILKLVGGVPPLLIEYPQFIKSMPPTKEDIEIATKWIENYKNYKATCK